MDPRWHRLFEHLIWADTHLLSAFEREVGGEGDVRSAALAEGLRLLTHILQAEAIWVARLEGRDTRGWEVWPEPSLEHCQATARGAHAALETYLERLGDTDPMVTYRNQSGRSFEQRSSDILLHLFLHGAYHRGQIARALRAGGVEPVNTDLIAFVRERVP